MEEIDVTEIIVAFVGSGGLLTAVAVAWVGSIKSRTFDLGAEQRTAAVVTGPQTGEVAHDVEPFRMAQSAMELANNARENNERMKGQIDEVKAELSKFRRSYLALYEWSQRIIYNWPTLRLEEESPDLPPDIHHP